MNTAKMINQLRTKNGLSQEAFAELFGVSRQAVQKWEAGASKPDIDNVIAIAKYFGVSVDAILFGSNKRTIETLEYNKPLSVKYEDLHFWDLYGEGLLDEYRQSIDEGLDVEHLKPLIDAVSALERGYNKERLADIINSMISAAPVKKDYPYNEPSDLEGIRLLRKPHSYDAKMPNDKVLLDKIHGAWLGRICGCWLGKPVECMRTDELHPLLKETDNFPMHRYILSSEITDEIAAKYTHRLRGGSYIDVDHIAPVDDDTNYTVIAKIIIDTYGRDFTPADVGRTWINLQSKNAYCTAERVAFLNLTQGYFPPDTAIRKNPYREWIGAQIRGDYFGYINPGNPETAAEMAWRDASISHIKNGIYGEMFIAAMLACAATTDNVMDVVLGGLAQIPSTSRLYEKINDIIDMYNSGVSEEDCFKKIHTDYNEHESYDWCHTNSNAAIVVASLLYCNKDYGRSICRAVQVGFDTDCNGATVGSILGMMLGASALPTQWTAPTNGKLRTSIFGHEVVEIEKLAQETLKHIK